MGVKKTAKTVKIISQIKSHSKQVPDGIFHRSPIFNQIKGNAKTTLSTPRWHHDPHTVSAALHCGQDPNQFVGARAINDYVSMTWMTNLIRHMSILSREDKAQLLDLNFNENVDFMKRSDPYADAVRELLRFGGDPDGYVHGVLFNQQGDTQSKHKEQKNYQPLRFAIQSKNLHVIRLLINAGAHLDDGLQYGLGRIGEAYRDFCSREICESPV